VGRTLRRAAVLVTLLGSLLLAGSAFADSSTPPVFVIGDGNAAVGTSVTFWGAQWAKDNTLSGGAAPSAFKGLAVTTDLSNCQFTTGPGNSVGPPASLPPGDVLVLVASSILKSGSSIGGTFSSVAVVQPDPGYASDPGHAGTGTVVGTASNCSGGF
jgi:hypothetical protein